MANRVIGTKTVVAGVWLASTCFGAAVWFVNDLSPRTYLIWAALAALALGVSILFGSMWRGLVGSRHQHRFVAGLLGWMVAAVFPVLGLGLVIYASRTAANWGFATTAPNTVDPIAALPFAPAEGLSGLTGIVSSLFALQLLPLFVATLASGVIILTTLHDALRRARDAV